MFSGGKSESWSNLADTRLFWFFIYLFSSFDFIAFPPQCFTTAIEFYLHEANNFSRFRRVNRVWLNVHIEQVARVWGSFRLVARNEMKNGSPRCCPRDSPQGNSLKESCAIRTEIKKKSFAFQRFLFSIATTKFCREKGKRGRKFIVSHINLKVMNSSGELSLHTLIDPLNSNEFLTFIYKFLLNFY